MPRTRTVIKVCSLPHLLYDTLLDAVRKFNDINHKDGNYFTVAYYSASRDDATFGLSLTVSGTAEDEADLRSICMYDLKALYHKHVTPDWLDLTETPE